MKISKSSLILNTINCCLSTSLFFTETKDIGEVSLSILLIVYFLGFLILIFVGGKKGKETVSENVLGWFTYIFMMYSLYSQDINKLFVFSCFIGILTAISEIYDFIISKKRRLK